MECTHLFRVNKKEKSRFQIIEDSIKNKFLPKLFGIKYHTLSREITQLPVKYGGIEIPNPVSLLVDPYITSRNVTEYLVNSFLSDEVFLYGDHQLNVK